MLATGSGDLAGVPVGLAKTFGALGLNPSIQEELSPDFKAAASPQGRNVTRGIRGAPPLGADTKVGRC